MILILLLDFPPSVVDAAKSLASDELKKQLDEAAMILKSAYW